MKKLYFLCLIAVFAITMKANAALTVDDLVGTYNESISGSDWWNWTSWVDFEQTDVVTISKVDDTTIKVTNLYDWETDLTGKVNLRTRTITFEPQNINEWYIFCGYPWDDEGNFVSTNSVVATISEDGNTIEIASWSLTYPDYSNAYVLAYSVLTKAVEAEALWTATGNYDAGGLGAGEATITAYDDGSYDLGLPLNHNLKFTVDENGQFVLTGGTGEYYEGFIGIWFWNFFANDDCISLYDDEDMVVNIAETGGVISFPYEYYTTSDAVDAIMGTYTFTWGTGTGITGTKAVDNSKAPVYNLSGMRMANPSNLQKGVYISNGKKFVVK